MTLDEARASIGAAVRYTPYDMSPGERLEQQERGVITSVGAVYAFVRYGADLTSKGTAPVRLALEVAS